MREALKASPQTLPRGAQFPHVLIKDAVEKHPADVARLTAEKFGITRQAVHKHLQRLVAEKALVESGKTRNRKYSLASLTKWRKVYPLTADLEEGAVWRNDIRVLFDELPANVVGIWEFCFTEMFNNAIEHSGGAKIRVVVRQSPLFTAMAIHDDGVGIFKKIKKALNLPDEEHAVLELAKGKLTTAPKRHTGEGVFFASRIVDQFRILSGKVHFRHYYKSPEDWIIPRNESGATSGTTVAMAVNNHTSRTAKKIFDQFSSGDNDGFTRTVVPVELAKFGDEHLISRSQAKRLVARLDRFKAVDFDFTGVAMIGQAFADEIFRVFANDHPQIELRATKANSAVKRMIARAKNRAAQPNGDT